MGWREMLISKSFDLSKIFRHRNRKLLALLVVYAINSRHRLKTRMRDGATLHNVAALMRRQAFVIPTRSEKNLSPLERPRMKVMRQEKKEK